MKSSFIFALILALFSINQFTIAQPSFSYSPSNTTGNNIPFNHTSNLKQNLYLPSDFTGAPSGIIQTLFIKSSSSVTANYTNLTVKMGPTTMTSFTSGPYASGLTTVYNAAASLTTIAGNWIVINLTTPYLYNNTQNLIIEFSQTGASPGFVAIQSGGSIAPNRALYGPSTVSSGTSSNRLVSLGFDIVSCIFPTGIQINNITMTNADIHWDPVASSSGYEYHISTSSIPPISGTATLDTFHYAQSLSAGVQYYAHVRNNCGSSFSSWVTSSFTTVVCPGPAGIQINNITMTSADVHWDTVTSSNGYEYDVSTSSIPPASGTATLDTFYYAQSLAAGNQYYARVRNSCGSSFSFWVTNSFTTVACPAPAGIQIDNITRTSADVHWDNVPSSNGFEYHVSTSSTPPASGIATLDTFYYEQSLSQGTQYFAHVRNSCGSSFSSWVTSSFTTDECMSATPNVNNITDSSADITWAAIVGATNYQYDINNNSTPPATGTLTAAIAIVATGLTDSTQYYAHVRSICASDTSNWSTVDFITFKKSTVGIHPMETDEFRITAYPNPVQKHLTIDVMGNTHNTAIITINDLSGRVVKKVRMQNNSKMTIDLSYLKTGVYLIRYQDESHVKTLRVTRE